MVFFHKCFRFFLFPLFFLSFFFGGVFFWGVGEAEAAPPSVTLEVRSWYYHNGNTYGNSWSEADDFVNFTQNTQLAFKWSSSGAYPNSCDTRGGSGGSLNSLHNFYNNNQNNGEDYFVNEPSSGSFETYTVTCSNDDGTTEKSIVVNNGASAATARLERKIGNGSWTTENGSIAAGYYPLHLRWSSDSALGCSASGSGFDTGGNTDGTDTSITEPDTNSSKTYTVTCTSPIGNDSDSITIINLDTTPETDKHACSETSLQAEDRDTDDRLGYSVAIDGNIAVVGAPEEDTGGSKAGAVYIFEKNDGSWAIKQKIQAEDKSAGDEFGNSVDIYGTTIVVGAHRDGSDRGAAYIFDKLSGSYWSQQDKLQASDGYAGDRFGISVAIDKTTFTRAVVGAYKEDTGGGSAGAAYIFTGAGGKWLQQKIQAEDKSTGDGFGYSVAVNGDTVVVGAPYEDNGGSNAGAAYIFDKNDSNYDSNWSQQVKLQAGDKQADDAFGDSVAVDGDTVIVGAPKEDSGGSDAGAAYIFKKSGSNWNQQVKLQAGDKQADDAFGDSVAVDGDTIVVGAYKEDSGGSNAGAAYLFNKSDDIWYQKKKLQPVSRQSGADLGRAVAIEGNSVIVGAPNKNIGSKNRAGTAYIFTGDCDSPPTPVTNAPLPPPIVTLEKNIYIDDAWIGFSTGSAFISSDDQQVYLRWSSVNANSCSVSGSGFTAVTDVVGNVSGQGYTIVPVVDTSITYTVNCTGFGGSNSDSLTITHAPPPTVTLERKHKDVWNGDDVTIKAGDRVDLRWSSTDTDSCSGTGPGFSVSATSGYDWFIDEPTIDNSSTYTVTCTGPGGMATDSLTITTANYPTVTLEQSTDGGINWGEEDVTIGADTEVRLRWSSTDATSCTGSGPGFSATHVIGTDATITEPAAGASSTYSVTCTGLGGTTTDSITVTNLAPTLTVTVEQRIDPDSGSVTAWSGNNATISDSDDEVHIKWSSENADSCSGNGHGLNVSSTAGTDYNVFEPGAGDSITYTISCTGGGTTVSDSVTISYPAPPTVTVEHSIYQNGTLSNWSDDDTTINSSNAQAYIRWSSTGAKSCTTDGNHNFSTYLSLGNETAIAGTDVTVDEPTEGNSITYTVTCTGNWGTASSSVTIAWLLPLTATLQKNIMTNGTWSGYTTGDATIGLGDSVYLYWTSTNATSCSGTGFNTNNDITGGSNVTEPLSGASSTYTLTCTGPGGSVTDSLTITTANPPVTLLQSNIYRDNTYLGWTTGDVTIKSTDQIALKWSGSNATGCTGTGPGFDAVSRATGIDNSIIEPAVGASSTYSVTCTNQGGSTSDGLTVTTANPPVTLLQSNIYRDNTYLGWTTGDVTIKSTDQIALKWSGSNATGCTGTGPGFDAVSRATGIDNSIIEPAVGASSTYSVTCTGPGGTDGSSVTITTAPAPTATLEKYILDASTGFGIPWSTGDATIDTGDAVYLRWDSTNATGCTATAGNGFSTSGNKQGYDFSITEPTEGNFTAYILSCTGSGGTVTTSITITTYTPAVTVTLEQSTDGGINWSGEDIIIGADTEVRLRWSSTNANSCTGSGPGFSATSTTGTDTTITEPAVGSSTTYSITCTGPGGTDGSSVTITTAPAPTATLEKYILDASTGFGIPWSTGDATIDTGDAVYLRWDSTNATGCTATAGNGFSTSGNKQGYDFSITEPTEGNFTAYILSCTGSGGTVTTSITITTYTPAVTVTLEQSTDGGINWSGEDIIIVSGTELYLRWSSTNASSCSGQGFNTDSSITGSSTEITEPDAGKEASYVLSCFGSGSTVSDSISVTTAVSITVTLEQSTDAGASWSTSSVVIGADDHLSLRWNSTGATACVGTNFYTATNVSGINYSITEPAVGLSTVYTVSCSGLGGTATSSITITKAIIPTVQFERRIGTSSWSGDDATISVDDEVSLQWSSTNADSCTGSGPGFATLGATVGTDITITEPGAGASTTYTITCTGTGGTVTDSIIITKAPVPIVVLEVQVNGGSWSREDVSISADDEIGLRWSSANANSCQGFGGGFDTSQAASGISTNINEPSGGNTIIFIVICDGDGGSIADNLRVTKVTPPTVILLRSINGRSWSGENAVIDDGDWIVLQWISTNADSCTGSGPGLEVNSVNGFDLTITEPAGGASNTYDVSCTGAGGIATDSLTLTKVEPPVATLEVRVNSGPWGISDITIDGTDELSLRWNGANADSCSGQGFFTGNSVSGINDAITEPDAGKVTHYVLSCTGSGGSDSDTISVRKTAIPRATLEVMINSDDWKSNDVSIAEGDELSLRWESENTSSCSGHNFTVSGVSGINTNVIEPNLDNSITYTLSCTGPSGNVDDSITVLKTSAPIVTLEQSTDNGFSWSEDDVTITSSDEVYLRWNSKNANNCSANNFTAGSASGTDTTIIEPTVGTSRVYTLTCTGEGGSESESLAVFKTSAPTVILEQRVDGSGPWSSNNAVITTGSEVHLRWNSNNSDSCTGTNVAVVGTSGVDRDIVEPPVNSTRTYIVICVADGSYIADSLTVSVVAVGTPVNNLPTVTLERQIASSSWSGDNVVIDIGEEVALRWSGVNVNGCTSQGDGFDVTGVSGTDNDIIEPSLGTLTTYIVSCTGSGSTVSDSLTVNVRGGPIITAEPYLTKPASQGGSLSTISWDTKGTNTCTLDGPGLLPGTKVSALGNLLVVIREETQIYTITCPNGVDTATIYVIPKYFEE